jgi:uncharacterized phiE125 gp8 family phage protein
MAKALAPYDALQVVQGPSVTPVTVAECKDHLRLDFADDDAYIGTLLDTAVSFLDGTGALSKAMITQTWRQYFSAGARALRLSIGPVQSVQAVKYYDTSGNEQAASLSDFDVFGTSFATTVGVKSGKSWPVTQDRPDALWVEYVSGYGDAPSDVPDTLRHAIKFMVAHWYTSREPVGKKSLSDLPLGIAALVNIHRGSWYG